MQLENNLNKNEEVIDLLAYWKVILKYKFKIIGFAFFTTLLVAVLVAGMKPVYRATASILIKAEQDKAVSIDDVYTLDTSRKEYFLTQYEILKSRSVAEDSVDRVNLSQQAEYQAQPKNKLLDVKSLIRSFLPKPEKVKINDDANERAIKVQLVSAFQKNLTISPVRKTQLVNISFDAQDPVLAASVANIVGDVYIEQQLDAKLSVTKKAVGWLGNRLEQLRDKLDLSESKLQAFRKKENLIDIEGVGSIVADEVEDLLQNYRDARKRRVQTESIYLLVNNNNTELNIDDLSSLTEISSHPVIREIKRAEIEAEKKASELAQRYGPKHPKMISATAELATVRLNLKNQILKLVNGIKNELEAAKESERRLEEQLDVAKSQYQIVSGKEAEYLKLKREVESNRNLYNTFLSRFKETDIATDFDGQQARIIDRAEVPTNPIKPKKSLIVALAFVASLGLAIVMVLVLEALNDSFRTAAEIENKLGQRFLGLLPLLPHKKNETLKPHVYYDDEHKQFAESVRTLRTGFVLSHLDSEHKIVAVTSSVPGEGKTTTATNLAFAMSQMENTLLIEADMRKPSFNRLFSLPPYQAGLSNIISGSEPLDKCILKDAKSGLNFLPAGHIPPNPLELLSSDKFAALLEQLKNQYDRIIIDTAPTQAVSDALVVSKLSDSMLYVIKADSTKQALAKQGIGRLLEVEAKIDGIVLNQVNIKKGQDYGYQGYYDYYGYSEEPTQKKA
ncbi:GumC family protein [Algibacillus agarilyticus]|uniref:GumC family protein n=1 Tax=Algibacillus agarilyticus TaxID=2234133 RepID=UPI000DCF6C8F|nr:polysaccharide biosynthesis tyrosine autokinase [Algibacillus agarilyticus]